MPVIRTSEASLKADNRPDWCAVTSAGIFSLRADGNATFDCHYHDCDEYWLVYKGKARVASEGVEAYAMPGDIVCTRAGDEHDVLEVYEDFEAFYFEDSTPESGKTGHLHRSAQKAEAHPVPARPLPADFPT